MNIDKKEQRKKVFNIKNNLQNYYQILKAIIIQITVIRQLKNVDSWSKE